MNMALPEVSEATQIDFALAWLLWQHGCCGQSVGATSHAYNYSLPSGRLLKLSHPIITMPARMEKPKKNFSRMAKSLKRSFCRWVLKPLRHFRRTHASGGRSAPTRLLVCDAVSNSKYDIHFHVDEVVCVSDVPVIAGERGIQPET